MGTLARRAAKTGLFVVVATVSLFYVRTYPQPMPLSQLDVWWAIADWLAVGHPDNVIVPVMLTAKLVVTVVVYAALIRLIRMCRQRFQHDDPRAG